MPNTELMILTPIFIVLVVVTFNSMQSALDYGKAGSFGLAICVSLLSVIGMRRCLAGQMEVILLPYAALAITILLVPLVLFVGKYFKGRGDRVSDGACEKKVRDRNSDRLKRRPGNDVRK
jgi:hypothetical protein